VRGQELAGEAGRWGAAPPYRALSPRIGFRQSARQDFKE